ncbi:hypothetical protein [Methanosphaerula palustris]|nr:hypothetical protein [Methanosphaerula palustris]
MVVGLLAVIVIAVTAISYLGLDGGLLQGNLQGMMCVARPYGQ